MLDIAIEDTISDEERFPARFLCLYASKRARDVQSSATRTANAMLLNTAIKGVVPARLVFVERSSSNPLKGVDVEREKKSKAAIGSSTEAEMNRRYNAIRECTGFFGSRGFSL